ncbi:hypothetical protein C8J56DRAFT_714018, partial [Mycena floridula]
YPPDHVGLISARVIHHIVAGSEYPLGLDAPDCALASFIARALQLTNLHSSVVFGALIILDRVPRSFMHIECCYRLFLIAFRLAWKVMTDFDISSSQWRSVIQGLCTSAELASMEWDLCQSLDWDLVIHGDAFYDFVAAIIQEYGADVPH